MVRRLLILGAMLTALPAAAVEATSLNTGLQQNAIFTDYSPFSRSPVLLTRLLSPLNAMRVQRALDQSGKSAREQSIDLAQEQFAVYVPPQAPAQGYALLVFVPPWEEAKVPSHWISALDRHGMIFVSAAKSGNDADVLDRREPLALLAAYNIMQRYPVDPARVYVSGFSGGSRVALRLALAYPELFRGALLDAGSDPIGDAQIPLPPAQLFHQFQESTQLVYLTGKDDAFHLDQDAQSRKSLHEWCVFDLRTETPPWTGHEPANAAAFDHALSALARPAEVDPGKLADCRSHVENEMTQRLQQAANMSAQGNADAARKLLDTIDTRYGGVAAPRSVELANKLDMQ